jgi:2-methylcitrate dehydratase PrpD
MSKSSPAAVSAVMSELSAYIAAAVRKPLPKAVVEVTKHHVLDTLAAMISGSRLEPGRRAIAYAKALGGKPECTVAGSRIVTNAVNAALANGMLAHSDETDDSHAASLTHPGCGIVAAALAMAERERRDGTSLLRAVALGYDVNARMSYALHGEAYRSVGHSTHSTAPTFGAAAAGAALARLDARRVRHVLSYAAQQASGISCYTRDLDHVEKAFDFGGVTARNGVAAATLVAAGCSAVDDVFSGERNFFIANDESGRIGMAPDPQCLIRDLGRSYEIMNTNIKRWTVGSPIQAPLDSLLELIRTAHLTADDVERVTVRVSQLGANTTNDRDMPDICMQYLCAVMLIDGIVTFDSAHDVRRMRDRRVRALWQRIEVIGDEELQRLLPERHGIVEIACRDGRSLRHHTSAVRGTTKNPMTRADVDEKCYQLVLPVIGRRRARDLCDAVWSLEKMRDLRKLRPLLRA